MKLFEVLDKRDFCEYHKSKGHSTANCLQLRDVLEKLARQGDLIRFIKQSFFQQHRRMYNGTNRKFKYPILRKESDSDRARNPSRSPDHRRSQSWTPQPNRNSRSSPSRERSHEIEVIMGGVDEGVSTRRERRGEKRPRSSILNVEERRPWSREPISFSARDEEGVHYPHNDAIVLALKMGPHRVKRVLVDTRSFADVLYFDAFLTMGYEVGDLRRPTSVTPLSGFTGDTVYPLGYISVPVIFGKAPRTVATSIEFLVIDLPSVYNAILGRKSTSSNWCRAFFLSSEDQISD